MELGILLNQTSIRLGSLVIFQVCLDMVRVNLTRWIIRSTFGSSELPAAHWFNLSTIMGLSWNQVLGLIIIASFTLITFPLGIWIGSFKLGISIAVSSMIAYAASFIAFPINTFIMNKFVGEFVYNNTTYLGILLLEGTQVMGVLGWFLIYKGNVQGGL